MATMGALLDGVTILSRYTHNKAVCLKASHNQIWVGPEANALTLTDAMELEVLGWVIDEERNQWSLYI